MSSTSPPSQTKKSKPIHEDNNETVAPKYKPRYAHEDTTVVHLKGHSKNESSQLLSWLFNSLCFCFSLKCFHKKICSIRRPIFLYLAIVAMVCLALNQKSLEHPVSDDYMLAKIQSHGLFQTLSQSKWLSIQEQVKQNRKKQKETSNWIRHGDRSWHADFNCPYQHGVGERTICHPLGIGKASSDRLAKGQNDCLVYSVVSDVKDLTFEKALLRVLGTCEIHVFSSHGLPNGVNPPPNVHLHTWGFRGSKNSANLNESNDLKSMQETIRLLGHEGKTVDLFMLDCDHCELNTFQDWFYKLTRGGNQHAVDFMQIMVNVHGGSANVLEGFFNHIQNEGYVTYYKGSKKGETRWYGFLKLSSDFFSF